MLESLFNKVEVPHPAIVLKKDFKAVVFLLILQKIFGIHFFTEDLQWPLI